MSVRFPDFQVLVGRAAETSKIEATRQSQAQTYQQQVASWGKAEAERNSQRVTKAPQGERKKVQRGDEEKEDRRKRKRRQSHQPPDSPSGRNIDLTV